MDTELRDRFKFDRYFSSCAAETATQDLERSVKEDVAHVTSHNIGWKRSNVTWNYRHEIPRNASHSVHPKTHVMLEKQHKANHFAKEPLILHLIPIVMETYHVIMSTDPDWLSFLFELLISQPFNAYMNISRHPKYT